MKMKSMSMAVDEDNKETEEQNNAAIRKKEAIEFKDKGNKFVKNKEYESAIKMYTRAIELCSDDPVFYSNRAQCYLSLEKYQECIDDATKAIELDPKSSKSYFRRMTAYEKLGDDRKAMQSCSKLLDLTPEDTTSKNAYDRIINRIMEAEKKKDKEKIRWSRRGSSSKITNFVTKPPHLCSKKPMKNVPVRLRKAASPIPEAIIDRIFDNNTGETVPEMDSKLFKPKFLISNEVSPPKIAKLAQTTNIEAQSVENNDSVEANNNVKVAESQEKPTLEELEAHKSQKKPTLEELEAHKSQKKPTLEELEAHKNHLITIPLTGPKFFAAWKELTDIQRFLYLKNFVDNNADIGKLGPGAQLNSDMLSEIINTIYLYFMPLHVPFIRLLYDLGQNSEVSTLAMFMEDDEKKSKFSF